MWVLWCFACGASDGESAAQIQQALDQPYGGYTTAPEQPSFGQANVAAVPRFLTTDASILGAPNASIAMSSYRVALLWGHLPPAHDGVDGDYEAISSTWIGTVSVDAGSIDVARTLSFGMNDSVATRLHANVVSFVSHTLPFVSGLLLHVTVPSGQTTLHFTSDIVTTDLDLEQMDKAAGSVTHAADDQGLAAVGWNDTTAVCPAGIVYGRWIKLAASVGTLRGHVMGSDGSDLGYIRGIWGHAARFDADVFFAKTIDMEGGFRAMTMGAYGNGAVHGSWNDTVEKGGALQGVYSDGLDDDQGRGVFVAKWMTPCIPL